ncbi:hypothetical protein RMSM_05470 [Rhodopirellula maiorica SM1]|uniref:Uncharacterized protein n=1 Tax=Rhodopirellula maiorica SM1 TaxID=1265738 RepID=M5RQC8_9BACT|nr:hypothetical protein [Rhodopirellula maiorica]EMI17592.1 hypothetical protein RMSM_05470 [Rhodopirellula maiorica SM1]
MIFRLSHIAVILSLIVVTMIQPMTLGLAGIACAEKCDTTLTCQGCGCCEVSTADTPCGCCAAKPKTAKTTSTLKATGETAVASSSCCHDSSSSAVKSANIDRITDQASIEKTTKSSRVSACLCGVTTPPLSESTPRPPLNELRNLDVLSYLVRVVDAEAVYSSVHPEADEFGMRVQADHYSQRVLCIWRL